jgi:hypothetical protein
MSTLEVEINDAGEIHPLDPSAKLLPGRAALVWESVGIELYEMSESALADWFTPEEDAAWAYLQQNKS